MSQKKEKFQFNWETIDFEQWRGPELSFPVSAELVMVPEFDELVIAATESFPELWLVEPEEITVRVLHDFERGNSGKEPFNSMGSSDLGLRLRYFEGSSRDYVLCLGTKSKPRNRHLV